MRVLLQFKNFRPPILFSRINVEKGKAFVQGIIIRRWVITWMRVVPGFSGNIKTDKAGKNVWGIWLL